MVFGLDDAALVGLIGSGVSGGLNLLGQSQQQKYQQDQLQLAIQNYMLQKQQADRQYELSTAGQTDARGNQLQYIPGRGWVTTLTPQSQSIVSASDALQQAGQRRALTTGQEDVSRNFKRRLMEGDAADPLLRQLMSGYGAPTREGVGGRNLVSNVTKTSENADALRNAYSSAALRTGQGSVPLALNMQQLDKGGTAGIRSAIAESGAQTDPLFQAQMQQYQQGKLNPYNMLASRASNSSDVATQPENITGGLDTRSMYANAGSARGNAPGSEALYRGVMPALNAYGAQTTPNYDLFAAGVTANLKQLLRGSGSGITPWNEDSRNDAAYNSWRF